MACELQALICCSPEARKVKIMALRDSVSGEVPLPGAQTDARPV